MGGEKAERTEERGMKADKDIAQMAHLMRRTGFGASRDELEERVAKGYEETVEELIDPDRYGILAVDTDILFRYHPVTESPGQPYDGRSKC